jgi:hypothetical protein
VPNPIDRNRRIPPGRRFAGPVAMLYRTDGPNEVVRFEGDYFRHTPQGVLHGATEAYRAVRLAQGGLQGRIERAEKPGPIPLAQRRRSASVRPQLAQVSSYFATGKRIPDIRLRPLFSARGDDARADFEAA